jgi:hypothetical protein
VIVAEPPKVEDSGLNVAVAVVPEVAAPPVVAKELAGDIVHEIALPGIGF